MSERPFAPTREEEETMADVAEVAAAFRQGHRARLLDDPGGYCPTHGFLMWFEQDDECFACSGRIRPSQAERYAIRRR